MMTVIKFSHRVSDGDESVEYSVPIEQVTDVGFNPGTLVLKLAWRSEEGDQAVELHGEEAVDVFNQLREA